MRCFTFVFNSQGTENLPNDMCALLGLTKVFTAGLAYRGRRGDGFEGTIIYRVGMVG